MTQYLNLEKPTENDLNWGDSINENSEKIDTECNRLNTELANKSDVNHTHNFGNVFSPLGHNHNDLYPLISHTHNFDNKYSQLGQLHNESYSSVGHTHTGFASAGHTHSEIVSLQSRMTLAENRINQLFSEKADKSYVINLMQNFDHSLKGLTPVVNINGQGGNFQNLRINCFINSPAFLVEWHLSYQWRDIAIPTRISPQNIGDFSLVKPSANAPCWNGFSQTHITLRVKCRNPFLNEDWSEEVVLTDDEIQMFNFIDADRIISALAVNSNFQTTLASVIVSNPYLVERIVENVRNRD
jgi:hypothetical protein